MRCVIINDDDAALFNTPFTQNGALTFQNHIKEMRRMVKQQGDGFWIRFVLSLRSHSEKHRLMDGMVFERAEAVFLDMLRILICGDNLYELSCLVSSLRAMQTAIASNDFHVLMNPVLRLLLTHYDKPLDGLRLYFRFASSMLVMFRRWRGARRHGSGGGGGGGGVPSWRPPPHWLDEDSVRDYSDWTMEGHLLSMYGEALPDVIGLSPRFMCWLPEEMRLDLPEPIQLETLGPRGNRKGRGNRRRRRNTQADAAATGRGTGGAEGSSGTEAVAGAGSGGHGALGGASRSPGTAATPAGPSGSSPNTPEASRRRPDGVTTGQPPVQIQIHPRNRPEPQTKPKPEPVATVQLQPLQEQTPPPPPLPLASSCKETPLLSPPRLGDEETASPRGELEELDSVEMGQLPPCPPPTAESKGDCDYCGTSEREAGGLKRCARCSADGFARQRRYCSRACQSLDWKLRHKTQHNLLSQLRSESGAGDADKKFLVWMEKSSEADSHEYLYVLESSEAADGQDGGGGESEPEPGAEAEKSVPPQLRVFRHCRSPAVAPQRPRGPAPSPEQTATSAPAPEPTATGAPAPEPTATGGLAPEPTATGGLAPEPTSTGAPAPEPTSTGTPAPEPTATGAPAPEPTTTNAPAPSPVKAQNPAPNPGTKSPRNPAPATSSNPTFASTAGDSKPGAEPTAEPAPDFRRKARYFFKRERGRPEESTAGSNPRSPPTPTPTATAGPSGSGSHSAYRKQSATRPIIGIAQPPPQPRCRLWLFRRCDQCHILERNVGQYRHCSRCIQDGPAPHTALCARLYCSRLCQYIDWKKCHRAEHKRLGHRHC